MPGFYIDNMGGNRTYAEHESRFYTSFSWEIPTFFDGFQSYNGGILLKTAQIPSISIDSLKVKGGSVEYKYGAKPNYDDIKVTFYDTYQLSSTIYNWSQIVYSVQDGIRTANRYKSKTSIVKYLSDRNDNKQGGFDEGVKPDGAVTYELFGSWPSVVKESDLTYVEASIKTVDVTIAYDYFIASFPDAAVIQPDIYA